MNGKKIEDWIAALLCFALAAFCLLGVTLLSLGTIPAIGCLLSFRAWRKRRAGDKTARWEEKSREYIREAHRLKQIAREEEVVMREGGSYVRS